MIFFFFFSSRRRHTRSKRDWSSDVCSSDLFERDRGRRASGVNGRRRRIRHRVQSRIHARCFRRVIKLQKKWRSEEHTSELQSRFDLVCRLLLEKKKMKRNLDDLLI